MNNNKNIYDTQIIEDFHTVFSSPAGRRVLANIEHTVNFHSLDQSALNPDEAIWWAAQTNLLKMIENKINKYQRNE